MAEVYLARDAGDAGIDRLVALKLVLPHMSGEPKFVSMFVQEARIAATLDHPQIAQVLDAGEDAGEPYLVMEYVHGQTLQHVLRRLSETERRMPLGCALSVVVSACAALHYAHERTDLSGTPLSIVHRDVSPSNLMLRYDGTLKLLDFGIAKAASQTSATATGFFKGKVGYMSPEQVADEPLDRRSDLFNLGIVLYEATTGAKLFYADNPIAMINKIAKGRFTPPREVDPSYPPRLASIVACCLEVDADDRYDDAEQLQLALEAFAREERLDTSAVTIARFLEELYGEQPYPSLPPRASMSASKLVSTAAAQPVSGLTQEYAPPRSRAGLWAGAAVVAVAGLGIAAWTATSSPDTQAREAEAAPAPAAAGPSGVDGDVAAPDEVEAAATDAAPVEAPAADGSTGDVVQPPPPQPVATPLEEPVPATKKKRKRPPKRGGKSSKKKAPPKGMYP